MKRNLLRIALCLALILGLTGSALAETTFDGTVVSGESVSVTAPFGGTVSSFQLRAGDELAVGDVVTEVATTKVYAPVDGVISGLFGQAGDAVEDVAERMGAVLYIEPTRKYSVSASVEKAYNNSDNKYVNIGETVYLKSVYSSNGNTAVGTITAVDGANYTVETTSGELLMEEKVYIYRDSDYTTTSRIGRGTVSRTSAVAVGTADTGSTSSSTNSILTIHVQDGDTVTRGQLLYETVTGALDGLYATGNQIVSDEEGIIASVNISAGSTLNKGDTILTLYPKDKMQVSMEIDEYDLADIHEGDTLRLEFDYDDSSNNETTGTVALISHVSDSSGSSDAAYMVYIDFTPTEETRLGMTVIVSQPEAEETETTDAQTDATDAADTTDAASQTTPEPEATAEPAASNVTVAAE